MTDDTQNPWTGIGAMAEVAAMMMRTAFAVPIGAVRAACRVQERVIEVMESFVPGLDVGREKISDQTAPPSTVRASAIAAATPSTATAGAMTGWGPVTPQAPVTGWGPMPR